MKDGQVHSSDRWLQSWPTRLTPLVDVVCIAGAGAGASPFKPWQALLPAYCALHVAQLPGRENRIDETPVDDMSTVIDELASACVRQTSKHRSLLLFGHSMGAVLAFELARELLQRGRNPAGLVMSATTPPSGSSDRAALDDGELKRLLLAFDPTNQSMIENPELFDSLALALRADFQLLRSHTIDKQYRLPDVPTILMSGAADPVVSGDAVALWNNHLGEDVKQHVFDGSHQFPFQESIGPVTGLVSELANQRLMR